MTQTELKAYYATLQTASCDKTIQKDIDLYMSDFNLLKGIILGNPTWRALYQSNLKSYLLLDLFGAR